MDFGLAFTSGLKIYRPDSKEERAEPFSEHFRLIWWTCNRVLENSQMVEDAVQETFLRAWKNRESFRGAENSRRGYVGSPSTLPMICKEGLLLVVPVSSPQKSEEAKGDRL